MSGTLTVDDQIASTLTKQADDLTAIRKELCDELLACPPRSRVRADMDRVHALKISILILDGRLDAQPEAKPLFDKLIARGYAAPPSQPWNIMAALFGSLTAIERRLKTR
jgi:hypothetical protein